MNRWGGGGRVCWWGYEGWFETECESVLIGWGGIGKRLTWVRC